MEENDEKIIFNIGLTKCEYQYVTSVLNTFYDNLSKLPKRMRTPKFYILENLIQTKFQDLFSE